MELLLIHAAATTMMAGLVLFVAVVHYPLFALVPAEHFRGYALSHQRWTTVVVGPLMLAEMVTAGAIATAAPAGVPGWMPMAGLVLLGGVWVITFAVNVPQHERLAKEFSVSEHRGLVLAHGVRTVLWLARAGLAFWMVYAAAGALVPGATIPR